MSNIYTPSVPREWDRIPLQDGVEIAYTERGSGPPVVLVPGWTGSGEVFEHQLAELAASFRVVTFDPRGQGRSTAWQEGNSYPQHGLDLVAILEALDLGPVHLVGWSYGALACYEAFARVGPERLRSMTAIDQTPKPLATGVAGEWAEADRSGFVEELRGPMVTDASAFAADFAGGLLARPLEPNERRWLSSMHLATPRHVAESLLVSAMLSDHRDLVRSLNSKLPFANAVDRDWFDEAAPWLKANAPGSALWAMPSHLGFWESPADFNRRLLRFLSTGR